MSRVVVFIGILLLLSGCFKENGKLMITVFVPNTSLLKVSDSATIYIDEVNKVSSMGGGVQLEIEEGKHKLKVVHESKYYTYTYKKDINITGKTSINIPIYFKENTTISEKPSVKEIQKLFNDLLKEYNSAIDFKKELKLIKAKELFIEVEKSYAYLLLEPDYKIYFNKNLKQSNYIKISVIENAIKEIDNKLQKPNKILDYIFSNSDDFELLSAYAGYVIAAKIKIGDIDGAMSYIDSRIRYDLNYISSRERYLFSHTIVKALVDNLYFNEALRYINNQKKMLDFVAKEWNYKEVYYGHYTLGYKYSLEEYNKAKKKSNKVKKKKIQLPQDNMKVFKKGLVAQYMQKNGRLKTYELLKDVEQKLKTKKLKNTMDFCDLSFDYYTVIH